MTYVFDIEVYKNLTLVGFLSLETDEELYFEMSPASDIDYKALAKFIGSNLLIGFNSIGYDLWIMTLVMQRYSPSLIYLASKDIIEGMRPKDFSEKYGIKQIQVDHIDLMEVAPLEGSLKLYGARLHAPKLQELPIDPHKELDEEEGQLIRTYLGNDLRTTKLLAKTLDKQLRLREQMSQQYETDLRSKSDAQIAEAVIISECEKVTGKRIKRPTLEADWTYSYKVPSWMSFKNPANKKALEVIKGLKFELDGKGSPKNPEALKNLKIRINQSVYRMGVGGLHSSETQIHHSADEDTFVIDADVASYYPQIIINQKLFPKHIGPKFLEVYSSIKSRRLEAKKNGDKVVAESLKIVLNGSFGKFGSMWSKFYSPDLMLQTTLTGQLALLMLIERIEDAKITARTPSGSRVDCLVVSGNTDGVLVKGPRTAKGLLDDIIHDWERLTGCEMEQKEYNAFYARDVNSYIGFYEDGEIKRKGSTFANQGLSKNPNSNITVDAVISFLKDGAPLYKTIGDCKHVPSFLVVRRVTGGSSKDSEHVGKLVRYYYSTSTKSPITANRDGSKVPDTEGAKPCMELPQNFPSDIDYAKYVRKAERILEDLGYTQMSLF